MQLSRNKLAELNRLADQACLEAGKVIIREQTMRNWSIERKENASSLASEVVTELDFISQKHILECLKPSIMEYDLGILSEELEQDSSRFEKDYFWCIDPLDGTLPFTEGRDGFSVSIALVRKDGLAVIGSIYDPVGNELFSTSQDACRPSSNVQEQPSFTFICDRSLKADERYEELVKELEQFSKSNDWGPLKIIDHGGAAMNAIWCMNSSPACYIKFPKEKAGGGSIWDFAASSAILEKNGDYARNFSGGLLNLNNKKTTFMNEQGIFFASSEALAIDLKRHCHSLQA